jgi:hypothetical protein
VSSPPIIVLKADAISLVKSRVLTVDPVAIPQTLTILKPGSDSVVTMGKSFNRTEFKIFLVLLNIFRGTPFLHSRNKYASMDEAEYMLKILIIGDSGVGKSSLLVRFCDEKFTPSQGATVGVDFKSKEIAFKNKRMQLRIWDTYVPFVVDFLHS